MQARSQLGSKRDRFFDVLVRFHHHLTTNYLANPTSAARVIRHFDILPSLCLSQLAKGQWYNVRAHLPLIADNAAVCPNSLASVEAKKATQERSHIIRKSQNRVIILQYRNLVHLDKTHYPQFAQSYNYILPERFSRVN